jgi:hypothetical protein
MLVGGFSGSLSLRRHLKRKLKELVMPWGYEIKLTEKMSAEDLYAAKCYQEVKC